MGMHLDSFVVRCCVQSARLTLTHAHTASIRSSATRAQRAVSASTVTWLSDSAVDQRLQHVRQVVQRDLAHGAAEGRHVGQGHDLLLRMLRLEPVHQARFGADGPARARRRGLDLRR